MYCGEGANRKKCLQRLTRQLCSGLRERMPLYARYWVHKPPISVYTLDEFNDAVLRTLMTAQIRIQLDQRYLYLFSASWARIPLHLCGISVCRTLHALLSVTPCPFRIHVDARTYRLRYTHFSHDNVVDNYMRREEIIVALEREVLNLFAVDTERRAARLCFAELYEACADSPSFKTHPLSRAFLERAACMRQTK